VKKFVSFASTLFIITLCLASQQRPDRSFNPTIPDPAFSEGKGPVIHIDEGHNNFHTAEGRYLPFAKILRRDGYVVKSSKSEIDSGLLQSCGIFVISDPMSETQTSAYTKEEIKALYNWVQGGGALLLITDHAPDPPAIADLAAAFGVTVHNGWVLNVYPREKAEKPIIFNRDEGTLMDHPITRGRNAAEKVMSVTTFTGTAFKAEQSFQPLMVLGPSKKSWMPEDNETFLPETPKIDVSGWCQGAAAEFGKGRIAFFGEAAMFTAQVFGRARMPVGMNTPEAKENLQFMLNVVHWLSGIL
jgi:hypothetical protein